MSDELWIFELSQDRNVEGSLAFLPALPIWPRLGFFCLSAFMASRKTGLASQKLGPSIHICREVQVQFSPELIT